MIDGHGNVRTGALLDADKLESEQDVHDWLKPPSITRSRRSTSCVFAPLHHSQERPHDHR
jgi:hypothetical protein